MSSLFKTGNSRDAASHLMLAPELEQKVRDAPGDRAVLQEIMEATGADDVTLMRYFSALAQSDPRHDLSVARLFESTDKKLLAVVHYRKYLASHPSPEISEELAVVFDGLGKPDKAREIRDQQR